MKRFHFLRCCSKSASSNILLKNISEYVINIACFHGEERLHLFIFLSTGIVTHNYVTWKEFIEHQEHNTPLFLAFYSCLSTVDYILLDLEHIINQYLRCSNVLKFMNVRVIRIDLEYRRACS